MWLMVQHLLFRLHANLPGYRQLYDCAKNENRLVVQG